MKKILPLSENAKAFVYANKIVKEIVADLTDRRGLRHEWEQLDYDTERDVTQAWANIIIKNLKRYRRRPTSKAR